ncbi:hypothetical protein [Roseinatronobacter monicus]|uniref:Uncharacterized protein n=1 Tax=Roseinatronobacter monicus TaxID=393481 RepID=A0A543K8T3_9RHOB|nr:hypothetical protein [Roseinatronobacter monicus]TQM90392.1 hypothetical protein BD293_3771 [Roseinatronobacter monicus]TQM91477.1 hypothetical protein BD293_0028 [Roseinatronobacter monicus]TQM94918.1 hypothetical protein BD293_3610 [Roseinatronobacter monicus]
MKRLVLVLCAFGVASAGLLWAFVRLVPMEFSSVSAHDPRVVFGITRNIRHLQIDGQCGPMRYSRAFLECGGICGTRISLHLPLSSEPDLAALQAQSRADDVHYWSEDTQANCVPSQIDLVFDARLR